MKRPSKNRPLKRTGDIRKDLTPNQLAWIGSVTLAFNEVETLLDLILSVCFSLGDATHEVTSRINGIDGKIELAKIGIAQLKANDEFRHLLAETLGENGFALLKKLRDRIIHARIIDAATAIARSPAQRGKFDEILLTEKSLEAVYERLEFTRLELSEADRITTWLWLNVFIEPIERISAISPVNRAVAELRKSESESGIKGALSRYQQHQKDRLSLPPLPKFPDESELNAADARALQDRQDDMLKRLGPIPDYLKNIPTLNLAQTALKNLKE